MKRRIKLSGVIWSSSQSCIYSKYLSRIQSKRINWDSGYFKLLADLINGRLKNYIFCLKGTSFNLSLRLSAQQRFLPLVLLSLSFYRHLWYSQSQISYMELLILLNIARIYLAFEGTYVCLVGWLYKLFVARSSQRNNFNLSWNALVETLLSSACMAFRLHLFKTRSINSLLSMV